MAENETQENGSATDQATGVVEKAQEGGGSVVDKVKGAGSNGGGATKVLVPAALAAATAAVGYVAATRGGPKLKQAVSDAGASKAEDLAEGVVSSAEKKGGITGLAAKALKSGSGGGDGGGGVVSGLAQGVTSKLGGGKDKEPSTGWGRGRRNPVQRWVDVAVPVDVAYDQWTQFEEFPKFMHRVTKVTQDEEEPQKIHWEEKIWFSRRQWDAEIVEQIPSKRIVWKSVSGTAHTGRVTFHPLVEDNGKGEALTRVMVTIDFNPSGMVEKMASGLRFVKRATESDLARFKAFIEAHEEPTGTWEGKIEDGEVTKDAKPKEGKPIEETTEKLKPEGAGEQKKPSKDDEQDESEASADGSSGSEEEDKDSEEREAERREREERREERRAKQPA
jgi:uncharacterized membrane protein